MKKVKIIKYPNGKFAVCPHCGRVMAKRVFPYEFVCLFGCGYVIKIKGGLND